MYEAAQNDGITLIIVSGFRSYEYQKKLWEDKWFGYTAVNNEDLYLTIPDDFERTKEILKYTAMPGTSRHHWGTDIDLNSVEPSYFKTDEGKKIYEWLQKMQIIMDFVNHIHPLIKIDLMDINRNPGTGAIILWLENC